MIPRRNLKRLRCSFCGRKGAEVGRLIAGAHGHICDQCIGYCNRILDATPASFRGWQALTDEQLLSSLRPCAATVEATRAVLQTQIDTLREREVSWEAIGRALGVTRQAAWERFS